MKQTTKKQIKDKLVSERDSAKKNAGNRVISLLKDSAKKHQVICAEGLEEVAESTKRPHSQIAGVASFYSMLPKEGETRIPIRVCDGPVCMALGATEIHRRLEEQTSKDGSYHVARTSCLGLCDSAPAALVERKACGPLNANSIEQPLESWPMEHPDYSTPATGEKRIVLACLGKFPPNSLAGAIQFGAYEGLATALKWSPESVILEVEKSGLCGRGGAGFPTGIKWRCVQKEPVKEKYVICNADESEPGAFKDRVVMENNPHLVLEGMALAAFAVGASKGIIYVRGEYELSATRLETAIQQAKEAGWLDKRIAGSDFHFDIEVHRGAGAYICGEETALLESLEGKRGEPRLRPPYPTTCGYLNQPTVVNNVETLCTVPSIVRYGSDWYRAFGNANSRGTKLFSLSGHVRKPTVCEVPFGRTIRELLNQYGLGMRSGSRFKMALTGGAAGTLIPEELLDVALDFQSQEQGVCLGSGVIMIFDTGVSAVQVLEWVLQFFRFESCGKCTPCREGTFLAHKLVSRISQHEGHAGDLSKLRRLATSMKQTSFCGLGTSVALPIESALEHFAEDFEREGAS